MKRINLLDKARENNARLIRRQSGFTLLEIMVVVIIIGTIAGLVGVRVFERLEESRVEASKAQMSSFKQALDLFRLDNGFYPQTQQGLEALLVPPTTGRDVGNFRTGGYLNSEVVPLDPWGNQYGYLSDGMEYRIWSMGPDGRDNTPDDVQSY